MNCRKNKKKERPGIRRPRTTPIAPPDFVRNKVKVCQLKIMGEKHIVRKAGKVLAGEKAGKQ